MTHPINTRKLRLIAALGSIALSSLSHAAEERGSHLEPEAGYFASHDIDHGYERLVRSILVQSALNDSPAGMVTLPSFGPETMVYLSSKDGHHSLVSATVSKQIWAAANAFSTNKDEKITASQQEKELSADLATQIGAVFALATSQTRYHEQATFGLDGASYHFTARTGTNGMRSGQIWSPDADTIGGRLVRLGEEMSAYAQGKATAGALESDSQELLVLLRKKN